MTNAPPPGSNGPDEPTPSWGAPPPQPPAGPPPGSPPPYGQQPGSGYPPPQPGYQQPGYQPPGYYQQPGYGRPMGPKPANYLVQAILTTLFCCLPFGIVSIVYAAQVDSKYNGGDYAGALAASKNAKTWAWVSFGIGLAVIAGYVILVAIAVGSDTSTSYDYGY